MTRLRSVSKYPNHKPSPLFDVKFSGTRSQPMWLSHSQDIFQASSCSLPRFSLRGLCWTSRSWSASVFGCLWRTLLFVGHRVGSLHWLVWCWDLYADPHLIYIKRRWWLCGKTYFGTYVWLDGLTIWCIPIAWSHTWKWVWKWLGRWTFPSWVSFWSANPRIFCFIWEAFSFRWYFQVCLKC